MSELDDINKSALDRFNKLKDKMKLSSMNLAIKSENIPLADIDEKLLNKMLEEMPTGIGEISVDHPQIQKRINAEIASIDEVFNFINSLGLSPNLSLCIGLIFSYNKTKNKQNLTKVISQLHKELEVD